MSTKWTIGRRTLSGFIAVIILAGLGGGFAVYNFKQFEGELNVLRGTNKELVGNIAKLNQEVKPLSELNSDIKAHVSNSVRYAQVMVAAQVSTESGKAMEQLALAKKATQKALAMSKEYGKESIAKAMQSALAGIDAYQGAVQQVAQEIDRLSEAQNTAYEACEKVADLSVKIAKEQQLHLTVVIQGDDSEAVRKRMEMIDKTQDIKETAYQIQIAVDAYLRTRQPEYMEKLEILGLRSVGTVSLTMNNKGMFSKMGQKQLEETHKAFLQSQESVQILDESLAKLDESLKLMEAKQQSIESAIGKVAAQVQSLSQASDQEITDLSTQADNAMAVSQQKASDASLITMASVGATLLVGLLLAMLLTRGLVRSVGKMADRLSQTADQVTDASTQLNSSSDSLAEGATGQAASLEETSASLEELASMTKNNADNANQAQQLMSQTEQEGNEANQAMRGLNSSMQEISEAGSEIERIIKTIDEIAFQTNLLALNAAVEAARAGEAGAGFAVVADEVRSLALRAAEAASETQELIKNTMAKVSAGTGALESAEAKFSSLLESTGQVASLVSEIASASQEQTQGIDQINSAMNQIDKVTQETASLAQESSNGASHLLNQADQLHLMLQDLLALAGRSQNHVSQAEGDEMPISEESSSSRQKANKTAMLDKPRKGADNFDDDPDFESF